MEGDMTDTERPARRVTIENVNMPFTALVGLVIKFWLATLIASLVVLASAWIGIALAAVLAGAGRY
jgi:small-conductance mechanosensitive channel